jgi:hypothetical protein
MSQRVTEAIKTCKTNALGRQSYRDNVKDMIKYYDNEIVGNKAYIRTLAEYKNWEYESINGLLLKRLKVTLEDNDIINLFVSRTASGRKSIVQDIDDAVYNIINEHVTQKCSETVKKIKQLDHIIGKAPKLSADNLIVYRGANNDIYEDLICEGGKFYYTTPTYMSTSFTPSVSESFMDTSKCATFYTIELPIKSQGLYIHWSLQHRIPFENEEIDSEFEYILQRGSKFEVVSVDFKPIDAKIKQTYRDITCVDKHPFFAKHYTLRLVSQPTLEDLKKTYRGLSSDITINTEFLNFMGIEINPKKRSGGRSKSHK